MDLFYRGYDPDARITSGALHLSAAAARFAMSIVRSIPQLPAAAWEQFQRVLTVDAMWSLCLVLAGWLIATIVGGLIGLAVNALLIVYGLVELWDQIKATSGELRDWAISAYQAQNEAELDIAARHFATALSQGGITILEVLVTHRIFRTIEGNLRQRFPTPDWLEQQYARAVRERESVNRRRPSPNRIEEARSTAEKFADVTTSGVRYQGARRATEDVSTAGVVLTGAVLAVGTVAVAAWAASSRRTQS